MKHEVFQIADWYKKQRYYLRWYEEQVKTSNRCDNIWQCQWLQTENFLIQTQATDSENNLLNSNGKSLKINSTQE